MSYKQIKWLILIIPTITIAIWEYVRHEYLLPYISMELGNWLAPVLVFAVTMTLLRRLFSLMEKIQEELNRERATNAALAERERIGRELHDGIAQSLFLLSVKVDQMEKNTEQAAKSETQAYKNLRKTVHQLNEYVRQAISNLRQPLTQNATPWVDLIHQLVADLRQETGMQVHLDWQLDDERLTSKDKVELFATIREALLNIRKHAKASQAWISCKGEAESWLCTIEDDGVGFSGDPFLIPDRFGLKILQERAQSMGWDLQFDRNDEITSLKIEGGRS